MKISVVCSLLLLILGACSEAEPVPTEVVPAELSRVEGFMADPEAVGRGRALFIGTCAGYCHKTTTEASDALFLFDCEWKHGDSDQEIFDTVTTGLPQTRTVGFGNNFPEGEDDLWKIIAYLRTNQRPCF